jgi:hypothetical protein
MSIKKCNKCGKTSDGMPFHTCATAPPDHSAEDRKLAYQIATHYGQFNDTSTITKMVTLITAARRVERKEIERLKADLENLHLEHSLLRTDNHRAKERITELEADINKWLDVVHKQNTKLTASKGKEELFNAQESKLTRATAALELCERALIFLLTPTQCECHISDTDCYHCAEFEKAQQVLSTIKDFKKKE